MIVGALCSGIASYYFVAATSYPRSSGYLDARCSASGHGFPVTYKYNSGGDEHDEVCCDAAVYVSLLGNESEGFAGELKRRNCKKVQGIALFGWDSDERWRLEQAACPEYYSQMMGFATATDLNGTVLFDCKYNPEKRSSPFEVCIGESFSCDIVTNTEYDELKNYNQQQTQLVPLFLFCIPLGVALILFGCAYCLCSVCCDCFAVAQLAVAPQRREFSMFDHDHHKKSCSSVPA